LVGVEFVGQGEVAGADAVTGGFDAGLKFGAGDVLRLRWLLAREEFFRKGDETGNDGGGDGGGGGGGGHNS
jgi:hypothetical protein